MEAHSDKKLTVSTPPGTPTRSITTYLTWVVGALILVVGGAIMLSILGEPAAPRTSAERDIAKYETVVKESPRNAAAQAGMGAALVQAGSYTRAIEHLDTAIKLDAKPQYYLALAEAHQALGDTKLAISTLRKAQKQNEKFEGAWYAEGKIYFDQGNYAKAVGPFNRALELEPSAGDVRYLLGKSLEELGKREAAIDAYREVLIFLPDHKDALNALEAMGVKNIEPQSTGDPH